MKTRVLVAGVGNIFFRDDGFGPAVAAALLSAAEPLPAGVRVVDYGIRGMHLTYDLLDGVDALVLADAVPGTMPDDRPGSITVLEVDAGNLGEAQFDAHGMEPVSMLAGLATLGGALPPTYVVGCVPADVSEGIGLSEPVAAAVDHAVGAVTELVWQLGHGPVGPVGAAPGDYRRGGD